MTSTIHIGMPKTGSTSIQSTLFDMQRAGPVDFAYVTGDNHLNGNRASKVLCRAVEKSKRIVEKQSWVGKDEGFEERESGLRDLLVDQISAAKGRDIIFSSEDLVYADEGRLAEFRALFQQAGPAIRAMGYVRAPKAFMESLFQQHVKFGSGHLTMENLYPDYRRLFEKYDRVFGRQNVDLSFFDPKKLLHGCVVRDFAQRTNIEVSESMIQNRNDALSMQALSLLFVYRKFAGRHGSRKHTPGNKILIDRLRTLDGMKVRFHSSIIVPVLEKNREDLAWMEERLGSSLTANLEADDARAIKSESDLLQFEPDALNWLSELLADDPLSQRVLSGDPEIVAQGVHALYEQRTEQAEKRLARRAAQTQPVEGKVLHPRYLAKIARGTAPASKGVSVEQAGTLLSEALVRVRARMAEVGDAGLVVESLGEFRPDSGDAFVFCADKGVPS